MRNLKEEMKVLQDATEAKSGMHMAVEGDKTLRIYPDYETYVNGDTSMFLVSRYYDDKHGKGWDDRPSMITWGQSFINSRTEEEAFEDGYAVRVAEEQAGYKPYEI